MIEMDNTLFTRLVDYIDWRLEALIDQRERAIEQRSDLLDNTLEMETLFARLNELRQLRKYLIEQFEALTHV
jgi:hypothetical protein